MALIFKNLVQHQNKKGNNLWHMKVWLFLKKWSKFWPVSRKWLFVMKNYQTLLLVRTGMLHLNWMKTCSTSATYSAPFSFPSCHRSEDRRSLCFTMYHNLCFTFSVVLRTGMRVLQHLHEMWKFSKRCVSSYLSVEADTGSWHWSITYPFWLEKHVWTKIHLGLQS